MDSVFDGLTNGEYKSWSEYRRLSQKVFFEKVLFGLNGKCPMKFWIMVHLHGDYILSYGDGILKSREKALELAVKNCTKVSIVTRGLGNYVKNPLQKVYQYRLHDTDDHQTFRVYEHSLLGESRFTGETTSRAMKRI